MNKIKYKLPSKDEMEKTIERYLGFMSSNITTLGDLDYSKIIKMQDRGVWLLEWEKSEEEIKELIDDFVNIYGYIYKEGKRAEERTPIEDTSIEKIKDAVNSEKEKLLETSDEELQEMIEKCISEYNDFIVQLEKYKQSNTPDKEQSVIEKMNGYKQDIQQMLKILCANREKNIDIQKQDKLKLEQILANDKIEVKETATTGVVNLEKIIRKYKTLSDILGIKTFNSQNLEDDLKNKLNKITEEIAKQNIGQDFDTENADLKNIVNNYKKAKNLLQEMPIQLDQYEQNSISDLTACFNQRVQEIICRTACNKLNEEKQIILSEKDTFFSKLLGKTELKQAKIKNLEAKIKYITKKRDTSTTADVKEMLKEIHECANTYNNGKLTYEMLEIEELIKDIFTYIPNKDNSSEELNDNSENILPTIRKKSIFSWTKNRREASRLNNETLQIEQDTKNIKEPQPIKSNINSQLTNIYGQYSLTLEKVRRTIECR